MDWLIKILADTTVAYWKNSPTTVKQATLVLTASTALLICDRSATLGTDLSAKNAVVGLVISMLTFIIQIAAALIDLLIGGGATLSENTPKCARLIVVVWTLSLIFFFHNFIFGPVFDRFPNEWIAAGFYSSCAVAFLLLTTILHERSNNQANIEYVKISIVSVLVATVNTILFDLFILNSDTNELLTRNIKPLTDLFSS